MKKLKDYKIFKALRLIERQEDLVLHTSSRRNGIKFKSTLILSLVMVFLSAVLYSQEENRTYQYALIEAVKQKNLGNLPGAIELYKMVIEENATVAVAYYELGTLYALTGRDEAARKNLEKALGMDPENPWYFESYMEVLLNQGEIKTARNILKEKLKKDPDNAEYLFKKARILFMKGKEGASIRTLEKIEKERGVSDRITLLKANIFEQQKKYDRALEEVEKIISLFPESIQFRVVAAELAIKGKQKDRAAEYYSDVFELDSLNIFALTNLTDYYRDAGKNKESLFYLNKSFQSEEIGYEKKMAILSYYLSDPEFFRSYPNELEALIRTMLMLYPEKKEIHLFATDFYIQQRKYEEALEALEPVLLTNEKRYELWQQGILLANATQQNEKMLEIAGLASALFPDSTEILYFKGIAEYELEHYEEATRTFGNTLFEQSSNSQIRSQARSLLAEAHHHLKNYRISDSLFREVIRIEPQNYLIMNNFSYYLSLRGESLEEAEELSRKTIENNPENGTYLDTYAWILYKMGRFEDAEKYILLALKFGGENDPDVNEHAAEISLVLGSKELARKYFEKAILLGGDKKKLEERLNDILNEQ